MEPMRDYPQCMDICICDITELECLRAMFAPNAAGTLFRKETQLSIPPGARYASALAARVRTCGATSRRLHVAVPPDSRRVRHDDIASHKYIAPREGEQFVDFGSGVAGLSIEHFYASICPRLTFVQRLQLGFELCGWYTIIPNPEYENEAEQRTVPPASDSHRLVDSKAGIINNPVSDAQINQHGENSAQNSSPTAFKTVSIERAPLTTVSKLIAFAKSNPHIRGAGLALKALRFVADNARSPQEAKLAIAMTLPYRMGGYNRGPLLMDYLVEGVDGMRRCDCFLLEGKVDVEYGSTQHHGTAQTMQEDSRRANELAALGISVVNITSKELRDPHLFHIAMKHLARIQNRPLRIRIADFADRRDKLWSQLFPPFSA